MDTILNYLDEIDDILESSKAVPFSNNRISIDKVRLSEILEEIRLDLPVEIDKAQRIVIDHERIVEDAKRRAANIIEDARVEISKMADEHEIASKAYERAREIIEESQKDAKDMRINAMEYADGILERIEDAIRETISRMNQATRGIDDLLNNNLDLINRNRKELQENMKR